MITTLASLLAPVTENSFFEHFLLKSRLYVEARDSRRAESPLPWDAINRLLESDLLPPSRLKLVRANKVIPPMLYRGGDEANPINPRGLNSLLPQGVSIVIDGIEEYVPQLGRLSDSIERRLAQNVWINSYVSCGRGKAFKPHWDNHDVIVVQVHGGKRWRSFGVPSPPPTRRHRDDDPVPATVEWEGTMRAGDVLYLPRGEVHEAELETADSVHLTIGIKPRRGADDWAWLGQRAGSESNEDQPQEQMHAPTDSSSRRASLDDDETKTNLRRRLSLGLVDRVANDTLVVPALRHPMPMDLISPAVEDVTISGEKFSLSAIARRVLDLLGAADAQSLGTIVAALEVYTDDKGVRDAISELVRLGLVGLESQDSH